MRRMWRAGERYEYFFGKDDGDIYCYHTCLLCVELRTFFSCNGGWMWQSMWEEFREYLFPEFHAGCMESADDREPLSAAAKGKIVEAWRKWKGLR